MTCAQCKKRTPHDLIYQKTVGGVLVAQEWKCTVCGTKYYETFDRKKRRVK